MGIGDCTLRDRITDALSNALQPLPHVLAGWESGSVAFDLLDAYSDIDLNFLLDDAASVDPLYAVVESALETVSPITACHYEAPGITVSIARVRGYRRRNVPRTEALSSVRSSGP